MYQPTRDEYAALHYLAIALRPEWKNHPPGQIWQRETQDRTFPHAENFDHCVAAITDYCQASKNGEPVYKFPTLFPGEGDHWKTTVPQSVEKNPRDPCPDHPHDQNNHWNCIGCRSEILAGDRPANKQGIALNAKGLPVPAPRDQHDAA